MMTPAAVRSARARRGSTGLAAAGLGAALALASVDGRAQSDDLDRRRPAPIPFAIEAQDLNPAVLSFARRAGVRVVCDAAKLDGKRTPGVVGSLTPEEALGRLLRDSDLIARWTSASAVRLRRIGEPETTGQIASDAVTLEELSVTGDGAGRILGQPPPTGTIGQPPVPYAGGQIATGGRVGFLGNRSTFDTPLTQNSYTAQLIRDQQAQTITDVAANDPATRAVFPPFSTVDNLYIRGFNVNARDYAFDGLFGLTNNVKPAIEGIERIEILHGPSAFLYGFPPSGSVGGIVNLIPKRAGEEPLTRLTAQYLSNANVGGTFDIARRFGDGNALGIRINGTYRDGPTPLDHQAQRIGNLAIGLDYRGDQFRTSLDLGYQRTEYDAESYALSVLPGFAIPRAPRLTSNIQQPWERTAIDFGFGLLRAEYDIAPNLTAFGAIGASINERKFFITNPTLIDSAGTVQQLVEKFQAENKQVTGEIGVRAAFDTGPVHHAGSLVATHYAATEPFIDGYSDTYTTNLYAPNLVPRPARPVAPAGPRPATELDSLGVTDTLSILDDRVQLTGGGRFQNARARSIDPSGADASYYNRNAATPFAALLVKPLPMLSIYGSYAQGFGLGATAPVGAVNAGAILPPATTEQIEAGAKLDLGRVGVTLAFYEITQPQSFLDPTTRVFGLNGEQRNRGIDLNVFGEPAQGVRVLGGVTLLEGRQTKTAGGLTDGLAAPGVPDVQLNLGGEVDLPPWMLAGLTLSARVIYTSSQYYDLANTQKIPDWVRLDLGVRYRFVVGGTPLVARFNVVNAAGTNYYASTGGGQLSFGQPRTFLFSLQADL